MSELTAPNSQEAPAATTALQELAAKVKALALHMVGESADEDEGKFNAARDAFYAAVDELATAAAVNATGEQPAAARDALRPARLLTVDERTRLWGEHLAKPLWQQSWVADVQREFARVNGIVLQGAGTESADAADVARRLGFSREAAAWMATQDEHVTAGAPAPARPSN